MPNQLHVDYYQATIQIRPYNEEVVKFINNQVRKRNDERIFISKTVEDKHGVDFFISSNKFARIIGKKLTKSFKGELKESIKLYSRDRHAGKNLYRVTVCFRMNPFGKSVHGKGAKTPKGILKNDRP